MTTVKNSDSTIAQAAYVIAWRTFNDSKDLTPDERTTGHTRIRNLIKEIVQAGGTDPTAVAEAALGLLRQNEQISRSKARVGAFSRPPHK
jgi:hypothetical protein